MSSSSARIYAQQVAFWTLTLCAVASTALVVRQQFFLDSVSASLPQPPNLEPTQVDTDLWKTALRSGIRNGSEHAPIQIVEFADFECPACARYESTVETIRNSFSEHELALTFLHYPLSYHESAETAAQVAECAHAQGRFQPMRTLLFENQRDFGSLPWLQLAERAGISDIMTFQECLGGPDPLGRIVASKSLGDSIGIAGTPAIIINGWLIPGLPSVEKLNDIFDNLRNDRRPDAE